MVLVLALVMGDDFKHHDIINIIQYIINSKTR